MTAPMVTDDFTISTPPSGTGTSASTPPQTQAQTTSNDDSVKTQTSGNGQAHKKRRIPGACDICKKKKIRCDSGEMPGNKCSNCIQYGLECTHREVTKTLGSAKGYVESLEARLEKMDKLLSRLLPGIDLSQEVDRLLEEADMPDPLSRNDGDENEDGTKRLAARFAKLGLNPQQNRFFGKSSSLQLVQTALDMKSQYDGKQDRSGRSVAAVSELLNRKRLEFWEIPPWVSYNPETEDTSRQYVFPPKDLIASLVTQYFTQINPFLPLLHRSTFEKGIDNGLHLTDSHFGATVLLVCALGSRYSDDSRVFVEGSESTRSAGWKWFEQVRVLRASFFKRTSLHELQAYALFVLFSQSSETPQGCWSQVGMALRLAQEVGAHRRRSQTNGTPTAEDELWKRAFWVLVSIDRLSSSFSGRPCGLQDEDFDLDLPIECDDEYWEQSDPNDSFKQPEGKPSSIAFFNCYLSLMDILAYAMRAIYAIKQPKSLFGRVIQPSEQQIIVELDSAMNNWMDSVPQHLRWNPLATDNQLFLKQSAALYATYYHIQIFIHRPFIPSLQDRTPVTFPSLAICTNAARSCCHVLESYSRISYLPLPHLQITAFTAAVILLLNIWSGKRTGFAPNPKREMEDVQRCMNMLKSCEKRWSSAGRYWDILKELAYAGDVTINESPLPSRARSASRKRRRTVSNESMHPPSSSATGTNESTLNITTSVTTPSSPIISSPISPYGPPHPPQLPDARAPPNFSLPMYSTELGRLPVYGQFNFSDTTATSQEDTARQIQAAFHASSAFPGHFFSQQQLLQAHQNALVQSQLHYHQQPGMAIGGGPPYSTAESLFSFSDALTLGALFDGQLTGNLYPQMMGAAPPAVPAVHSLNSSVTGVPEISGLTNGQPLLDHDTMRMWSSAPTNFELDEWGTYIFSVNQMTHGSGQSVTEGQQHE
ncbi:hypothetical protein P691DRAFT_733649 [Macrolepiota fuliginosa MF-IS2]|uniref:Zn(2)-C6 fungal-type domain-containing protein n=1 Tax=Macrolepiota fuliginosa MF-IS2 TaxID=1400762 RepID=A0A9P6C260_9AGAR|nr:hypothetical protein P691DRAFT_733649 [Macrolepiota fuliginosa MF-IS2]